MKVRVCLGLSLCVIAVGCGGGGGGVDSGITQWSVLQVPDASWVSTLWMDGPNNVWVATDVGVGNWNGQSWSLPFSPGGPAPASGLWGFTSVSDLWAGTENAQTSAYHLVTRSWVPYALGNPATLTSFWASSPQDVWGGGPQYRGHFNGTSWTQWDTFPASSLWGTRTDEIWAVGPGSSFSHWDGQAWNASQHATLGFAAQYAGVWGSDAGDYWAVADGGAIAHFDGTQWTPTQSPVTADLTSIWGSRSYNVWAVGSSGTIAHWDGEKWGKIESPVTTQLNTVFGGGNEVWIGGSGGTIVRGH